METIGPQEESGNSNILHTDVVVKETPRKKTGFFKILLILLFVLLLSSTLFYFFFYKKDSALEQKTEEKDIAVEQLEGDIYLTLSEWEESFFPNPNIYKINLETTQIEEVFSSQGEQNYMANFLKDSNLMVFSRIYEFTPTELVSQMLTYNVETEEEIGVNSKGSFFARTPKFSPDGERVVYWSEDDTLEDLSLAYYAEDYSIYLLTLLDGEKEKIAQGAYPFFSPEGEKIIFLKNGGLYILNLVDMTEKLLLSFSDSVDYTTWVDEIRLTLSPSGESLLLTDNASSTVSSFNILDWNSPSYEEGFVFDLLLPHWPVFSPDGKYFAVQGYESEDSAFSAILFFDFENHELKKTISLENYDHDGIWLTDWLY